MIWRQIIFSSLHSSPDWFESSGLCTVAWKLSKYRGWVRVCGQANEQAEMEDGKVRTECQMLVDD